MFDIILLVVYAVVATVLSIYTLYYYTRKDRLSFGVYFVLFFTFFICFYAIFLLTIDISVVIPYYSSLECSTLHRREFDIFQKRHRSR
jgi:hypothetical protein